MFAGVFSRALSRLIVAEDGLSKNPLLAISVGGSFTEIIDYEEISEGRNVQFQRSRKGDGNV